ncbi:MAG: 30S ribosomal protein S20 [bacterium]|nr:30S ribosomal protein S20 [bacterium]
MPNTKTAKKAFRKSEKRRVSNLRKRRDLLQTIKDYKKTIEDGKGDEAASKLPTVFKKLDKAAKINLIKQGKANRLKARLSRKLKAGSTPASPTKKETTLEDQSPAPEL